MLERTMKRVFPCLLLFAACGDDTGFARVETLPCGETNVERWCTGETECELRANAQVFRCEGANCDQALTRACSGSVDAATERDLASDLRADATGDEGADEGVDAMEPDAEVDVGPGCFTDVACEPGVPCPAGPETVCNTNTLRCQLAGCAAVDQPCSNAIQCMDDLRCEGGACVACVLTAACNAPGACDDGGICNTNTGRCQRVSCSAEGAPCSVNEHCSNLLGCSEGVCGSLESSLRSCTIADVLCYEGRGESFTSACRFTMSTVVEGGCPAGAVGFCEQPAEPPGLVRAYNYREADSADAEDACDRSGGIWTAL